MDTCKNSGGIVILSAKLMTPIGPLTLSSCGVGFHCIKLPQQHQLDNIENNVSSQTCSHLQYLFSEKDNQPRTKGFEEAKSRLQRMLGWVECYFKNPSYGEKNVSFSEFCFAEGGTEFEISVWKALFETVELGQTTTYSKLASVVNNPKAVRAVGTALKKNTLPLLIPCHRVIRSDGTLGKFSGGNLNACKKYLIDYENEITGNTSSM